ncbi:MAG: ComEC/Rec2 family competence protein [Patescibacteria group bacterium]|nr:ComEC/Rec2 family competence protein [Patescibacteria group bacterium]
MLLLSFIGGILVASFFNIPKLIIYELFILGILYSLVFLKEKPILVFGICLIVLTLGILRQETLELKIKKDTLTELAEKEAKVEILGKVIGDPDRTGEKVQLKIKPEKIVWQEKEIKTSGKILLTTSLYLRASYGDELKISGKIQEPKNFEDFNYQDWLKEEGIYALLSFPEIEIVSKNKGNFFLFKILTFKDKLRKVLYQNLSPPPSAILGAVILGDKRKISTDWKEKLNIAGVRHITAVSGMHIVILTTILMSLLISLGFWRGQAFYLTIIFIALFILITGLQSSAIRAGIMGTLFLLAQKIGRTSASSRAVILAAALMLAINPLLLRYDIGFQLSFLAILGIIYLGPLFRKWLRFIPEEEFLNLRSILVMTFSAQIFTLPLLIYNFGRMSLIAPLTNVLILPFIYLIMLFGFVFALSGVIWQPLAFLLSLPVWLLLTYLVKIVDCASNISWASLTLKIPWFCLPIFYLLLGSFLYHLYQKKKPEFLNY